MKPMNTLSGIQPKLFSYTPRSDIHRRTTVIPFFTVTSFYRQRHCLMCSRVQSSARPWPSAGWEKGWSLPEDRQRCCWGWRRERETKQNDRVEGQIRYDLKDSVARKITVCAFLKKKKPDTLCRESRVMQKMRVQMQDEVIQIIF